MGAAYILYIHGFMVYLKTCNNKTCNSIAKELKREIGICQTSKSFMFIQLGSLTILLNEKELNEEARNNDQIDMISRN